MLNKNFLTALTEETVAQLGDVAWPVIGWVPPGTLLPVAEEAELELEESDDALTLTVSVPDLDPAGCEVALSGAVLTVRVATTDGESFERSFQLSGEVIPEAVQARHDDDTLVITAPKRSSARRVVSIGSDA